MRRTSRRRRVKKNDRGSTQDMIGGSLVALASYGLTRALGAALSNSTLPPLVTRNGHAIAGAALLAATLPAGERVDILRRREPSMFLGIVVGAGQTVIPQALLRFDAWTSTR